MWESTSVTCSRPCWQCSEFCPPMWGPPAPPPILSQRWAPLIAVSLLGHPHQLSHIYSSSFLWFLWSQGPRAQPPHCTSFPSHGISQAPAQPCPRTTAMPSSCPLDTSTQMASQTDQSSGCPHLHLESPISLSGSPTSFPHLRSTGQTCHPLLGNG